MAKAGRRNVTKSQKQSVNIADYAVATLPPADIMPTTSGRTSLNTGGGASNIFSMLMQETQGIKPGFEIELLKVCEHLAKVNNDISYAVDNIVQLGNTPATVTFDDGVDKEQTKEMLKYLVDAEKTIYRGGMNSLQNDLFVQLAVTGAISMEAIPAKNLKSIARVAIVDPYYIRFKYNSDTYDYDPYQIPPTVVGAARGTDMKKLNQRQYKYYAMRRLSDNPYGIPPFISAFESIELEKDMLKNLRFVIRKMGVFGFLNILVNAPVRKQNETDEAYRVKCQNYLKQIEAQAERGYANGIAIGFKNAVEYNLEANNANVAGARDILNAITEMKHAGIKQDPLMLGRNFNVAETMARVIMAKLTMQIGNYQRLVATVLEDVYLMMLVMAGYKVRTVTVEYEPPMIGDKLREEQAYKQKIENRMALRDKGIIDQQDVAQEIGYEQPFAERDVDYSVPSLKELVEGRSSSQSGSTSSDPKKDPKQAEDATAAGATDYHRVALFGEFPEFPYTGFSECNHDHALIQYASAEDETFRNVDDFILIYKTAIRKQYMKSVNRAMVSMGEALEAMNDGASVEQIVDRVLYSLYKEFAINFTEEQRTIVDRHINRIYKAFRNDESYLKGVKDIPVPELGLYDYRAIKYFKNSDELYLGKFITDNDIAKKLTAYIKEAYIKESKPLGKNSEAIAELKSSITDLLEFEEWKIARIIDTTVSRMRNTAAVGYMEQAGVVNYSIVGVNDSRQCRYCKYLNGKVFSVAKSHERFDKIMRGLPEMVKTETPFVTSTFGGDEGFARFTSLTLDELQDLGVTGVASHPFCRCLAVAVL